MTPKEHLKHSLKMKFGLPHYEPTDAQLARIERDIQRITDQGERPTRSDWEHAVSTHCPSAGTCSYSGVDNSDLNQLLVMATAKKPR